MLNIGTTKDHTHFHTHNIVKRRVADEAALERSLVDDSTTCFPLEDLRKAYNLHGKDYLTQQEFECKYWIKDNLALLKGRGAARPG